jgi:hypothetical protein
MARKACAPEPEGAARRASRAFSTRGAPRLDRALLDGLDKILEGVGRVRGGDEKIASYSSAAAQ